MSVPIKARNARAGDDASTARTEGLDPSDFHHRSQTVGTRQAPPIISWDHEAAQSMTHLDRAGHGTRAGRRGDVDWADRLAMSLGFFGVVFAVNGVMVHEALSTFGGVDTESAYQAGRMYEQTSPWPRHRTRGNGASRPRSTPSPAGSAARRTPAMPPATAAGLEPRHMFERPTDRRSIACCCARSGRAASMATSTSNGGQWDLVIELTHHGEQLFRSKNRIVLK